MSEITTQKDVEIVTRLVRGDTHQAIADELGISPSSVALVKKRQAEAIAILSAQLLQRKQKVAERILDKTHQLLESRVDDALRYEEKLAEVMADWNAEIDKLDYDDFEDPKLYHEAHHTINSQYESKVRALRDKFMTNSVLISLSKEMHTQATGDEGNPTVPVTDSKSQLVALVEAIKAGDEVKMQQIILNPKDD